MMDLLTVPGQCHYILAVQHTWGLYFPTSMENLIKLNRVPDRWTVDWIIGCYSGIKGSQTGRRMHLFREEEAGLLGTLKKEISCLLWSPQNPLGFIGSSHLGFWWVLQTEIGVILSLKCYVLTVSRHWCQSSLLWSLNHSVSKFSLPLSFPTFVHIPVFQL